MRQRISIVLEIVLKSNPALIRQDGEEGQQVSPDQSRLGKVVAVVMRVAATTPVNVMALLPSRL